MITLHRIQKSLVAVFALLLCTITPSLAHAEADTTPPAVTAIERVSLPSGTTPVQGPYSATPLYYKVTFSEPVTGVEASSFYVFVRDGCPVACASIMGVDTYPVSGQSSSDAFIIELGSLASSGTISIKPQELSGIVDIAANPLDSSSADQLFNSANPLVDYVIDTLPIEFDSFAIDGSSMHIVFNKTISAGGSIPLPSLDQFQFTDLATNQSLVPAGVTISGNELVIEFGQQLPVGQSLLIYFADQSLPQLVSSGGVETKSFSIRVEPDGSYVYCSPREGEPDSSCVTSIVPDTPYVTVVRFLNPSGVYGAGSQLDIELTLSEDVYLSEGFDAELLLDVGSLNGSGVAHFNSLLTLDTPETQASRITSKIVLSYIIQAGDMNADFDRAPGSLMLTSGNAEDIDDIMVHSLDVSTMPVPGGEGSLSDVSDIVVDGTGAGFPVVSPTSVTITPGSGTYGVGSAFTIYVTFDGQVVVTGDPYIQMNTGVNARAHYNQALSTPTVLAFTYLVGLGDSGSSLDYAFNTALQLNGGSIRVAGDPRNIAANLSLPAVDGSGSLSDSFAIVISGDIVVVPTVNSANITPASGAYSNSATITVSGSDVELSGKVVRIYDGGSNAQLCEVTVPLSGQWECVLSGLTDGSTEIEIVTVDGANSSSPVAHVLVVDTIVPDGVLINAISPQNNILINDPTPSLSGIIPQEVGGIVRVYDGANLLCEAEIGVDGSWSCDIVDSISDGSHVWSITITDRAGNVSPQTQWSTTIDATQPVVTSVSTPLASGSYSVGDIIPIDITFSEQVYVMGVLRLKLETGVIDRYAEFSSPDITTVTNPLRLNYTVMSGDSTPKLDYTDINALELVSGTIRDTAHNNAQLALAAPGSAGSLGGAGKPVISVGAVGQVIDRSTITPAAGVFVYVNTKVPVSGSAGSAPAGSILEIYYGPLKLCRTTVLPDGSWKCTIPILIPGTHTFKIKLKIPGQTNWTSTDVVIIAKSATPIRYCPVPKPTWVVGYRGSEILALRVFLNAFTGSNLPVNNLYDQELHDYIGTVVRTRYHIPILHCFSWWK